MDALTDVAPASLACAAKNSANPPTLQRYSLRLAAFATLVLGFSTSVLGASHAPHNVFGGTLHARGPRGVYADIRFEPHRLIARVHESHMCVLHAHLVHGDPHLSRYAIEPPKGGRFCDELVDGEIVIRPRSPNEVIAEFRSARMDWSGRFRRPTSSR